jgi:tRNA-binding protein
MADAPHQIATLDWATFEQVEMRVGTIVSAVVFEKARKPAYQLEIDFGPSIGLRMSSAQITQLYDAQALIGTQVIAVVNFPPKQIANFMSECLVLGAVDEAGKVILLQPERSTANGVRVV